MNAAVALLAYAALTIAYVHPLGVQLATHVYDVGAFWGRFGPYIEADAYLCAWILAWDTHALATQPLRLFQANDFYPASDTLAGQENLLGLVPFGAPVFWATGNALLAAQVAMLATYVIGGLGVFLLVRRWTGPWPAFVAGLAYVFGPGRVPALSSLQHLATHWWPFVLLALESAAETGSVRALAGVTAALAASALSCVYYGYAAFFLVGVHALVRMRLLLRHPRRALGIAAATALAAALLVPVMLPYLRLRAQGVVQPVDLKRQFYALDTLLGAQYHWQPPLAFAVIVLGALLRMRGGGHLPAVPRPAWTLALGLIVAGVVLTLGVSLHWGGTDLAIPLPYVLLARVVPGLSSARVTTRFLAVGGLGLAITLGLALAELRRRLPARVGRVAIAVAGILLGGELFWRRGPLPLKPVPVGDEVPAVYRHLRDHGAGRPLLEVPVHGFYAPYDHARAMYFSTVHWLPLLNGHTGFFPPTFAFLMQRVRQLPAPAVLQELVNLVDVGWILVHRDALSAATLALWERPTPGLEHVGRFDDADLFRVTLSPTRDSRDRLRHWFDATESLGGTPLVPLPRGGMIGRLAAPQAPLLHPVEGQTVRVSVVARNVSVIAWPAYAILPRHLVVLRARWLDRAGQPVGTWTADFRLPADVTTAQAVTVMVEAPPPTGVTEPQLEVALAQDAENFPAELSPPLRIPLRFRPAVEGDRKEPEAEAPAPQAAGGTT